MWGKIYKISSDTAILKFSNLFCVILLLVIISSAFIEKAPPEDATVNQVEGVYIFIESRPVASFDTVGTYFTLNRGNYSRESFRQQMILLKQYFPTTQGAIFSANMDTATVIKFK